MVDDRVSLELGSAYPARDLLPALRARELVVHTENGNRSMEPAAFFSRIQPAMQRCGITRIADVSRLSHEDFPVFQACRPGIWGHHSTGQNTGSQGKGATRAQAMVSCAMEAIESYCAEPRQARLYRSSYAELCRHHVLVPPDRYVQFPNTPPVRNDEPLMWTEAHSVELGASVLVPAEAVFVPFTPIDYATAPHFPRSTNGLASGATVLEAVAHALYELVERSFLALREGDAVDEIDVSPSDPALVSPRLRRLVAESEARLAIRFLEPRRRPSGIAVAICRMTYPHDDRSASGSGASSVPAVAVERAVSEAVQAFAVAASGAREDMDPRAGHRSAIASVTSVAERGASARAPRRRSRSRRFKDLRREVDFLVDEVHRLGYPSICIANLTRVGIDVPVVKVIVPGLPVPNALRPPVTTTMRKANRLMRLRFGVLDE